VITWANQSDLRIGLIALAITLIALAIIASTAAAASTRAEYVAQVDPICHAAHVKEKAAAQRFSTRPDGRYPGPSRRTSRPTP
jgi:hypothetical protein